MHFQTKLFYTKMIASATATTMVSFKEKNILTVPTLAIIFQLFFEIFIQSKRNHFHLILQANIMTRYKTLRSNFHHRTAYFGIRWYPLASVQYTRENFQSRGFRPNLLNFIKNVEEETAQRQ